MDPKTAVKVVLAKRGWSQTQLAEKLGIAPQTLSRVLGVPVVNHRSHWPDIMEELNLEVIVREKGTGEK